ncbi:uncharacterized protein METZ01_LOCUS273460 [marine metagenome]|uniref:VWFA domain-containing protein n=1 Tax=marine metagenome TaxID=408172 RepID=A0A382K9D9_9ZZZZ|tara:strand:- start:124 stop:813 length:690 start_codon:yes stop_codon:yes gene_type:complete
MNETKLKLHDSELANNPNTRIPICIALDVSGSMDGKKIDELNRGVNIFLKTIFEDEITRYSADIAILTFGGTVEKVLDFGAVEDIKLPKFLARGGTPMGEAVLEALDMLEDRKKQYQKNAVTYWQPWLVLMTDGAATDGEHALPNKVAMAAEKTCDLVKNKKLTLFSIIIEPGTPDELEKFCGKLAPLDGVKFEEFFVWLSQSVSVVSESSPGTRLKLPDPTSWTTIEW